MGTLTQPIINEFAGLLAVEDQSIWTIGDKINEYELGRGDIEKLAAEVDRSFATLWARSKLAAMFPADMWDRDSAPIGVWEQLSRLDKAGDRRRLLKKKAWTVNALRKEIDRMLEDDLPPLELTRTRVTRYEMEGMRVAMKSALSPQGILTLDLPAPIASDSQIDTKINDDGSVQVSIPLDMGSLEDLNDPRHLKVVK
jgi:hypothetical protein